MVHISYMVDEMALEKMSVDETTEHQKYLTGSAKFCRVTFNRMTIRNICFDARKKNRQL